MAERAIVVDGAEAEIAALVPPRAALAPVDVDEDDDSVVAGSGPLAPTSGSDADDDDDAVEMPTPQPSRGAPRRPRAVTGLMARPDDE
jgi:hypothetical protein